MIGRRDREGPLMRNNSTNSLRKSRVLTAVAIGVLIGCVFAFLFPNGFFVSDSVAANRRLPQAGSMTQENSAGCESSDRVNLLKSEFVAVSEKNAELKKQVRELTERLRLAAQGEDQAQKQFLTLGKQQKAGPFGTVKGLRTNPTVVPDESVNPRLGKILEKVAVKRELIVGLANTNVKEMLEVWFTSIKRVGITNYLVIALDDEIAKFCESNQVPVYKRDPDDGVDIIGRTGGNHAVSGLKFRILREFLQLGYSVLLSDVDIVYLQNPFDHLYRDSDVESMSDGHIEQQCEKLKLEVDSIQNQKSEVEEQMRTKDHENCGLREEILGLQGTIAVLEKTVAEKEAELSSLQEKLHEKESEASGQRTGFIVQIDNLKHDLASLQNEKEEVEQQCEKLKMELDSTQNQKVQVEEQLRAKDQENTELREEKFGLQGTITALQKTLDKVEAELSSLQEKLHEKESEASGQITAFTVQIENLKHDLASLQNEKEEVEQQCEKLKMELDSSQNQKGEVEEQIRAKDHVNTQLKEEISGLQGTITALENRLAEKESELSTLKENLHQKDSEASGQIAAFTIQIDNLKHDLVSLENENQELEQQCEKLKMEVDSTQNQKGEVEEQIRAKDHENTELREEILGLQATITALEKKLAEKESELSTLQEKLDEKESEASAQVIAFTAQIDNLQKDLLSLQRTKEELELDYEKISEEHAKSLVMAENEKNDISSRTMDLTRTLEERENSHQSLNEEYKKIDGLFQECMVKLEVAEKKIEEMAGEFREGIALKDKKVAALEHAVEDLKSDLEEKGDEISTSLENVRMLEVKLRLSNQKLRVTEQLLSEKEESFRKTEEKFQQDQKALEDRIAILSATITANNEALDGIVSNVRECVDSVRTGIEFVSCRVSDDCKNYEQCVSNISGDIEVVKRQVRDMNKEKEKLKREKRQLLKQLQVKNEEEVALKKTVEKLEAKTRKEESEKMNLTTTVVQLKKTVRELEKMMKEKEDGMLDLGEEKREVIRQLCLWIDYHRSRYDYLKDVLSNTRRGQRPA